MLKAEDILKPIARLPEEEQDRVAAQWSLRRWKATLDRIVTEGADELPVTDEECDRLVHEAREDMLRARGLRR